MSKSTSGRYTRSGPQPVRLARAAEPASQPAWRPMISMTAIMPVSYTRASCHTSAQEVAIYLAAEAKPGQWSVPFRSLSMVLGTPMMRHS